MNYIVGISFRMFNMVHCVSAATRTCIYSFNLWAVCCEVLNCAQSKILHVCVKCLVFLVLAIVHIIVGLRMRHTWNSEIMTTASPCAPNSRNKIGQNDFHKIKLFETKWTLLWLPCLLECSQFEYQCSERLCFHEFFCFVLAVRCRSPSSLHFYLIHGN